MSLCPQSGAYIPEATAQVARAAFPKGNLSLPLRDARAMMYHAFRTLFFWVYERFSERSLTPHLS